MRTQYCREHIDKAADECGLDPVTVFEVKQVTDFVDAQKSNPDGFDFSNCATKPIITLVRVKDEEVKARAIAEIKRVRSETDKNGKPFHSDKFTEKEMKDIIARAQKSLEDAREKENNRLAEEAKKVVEEETVDVAPLPAIKMKAVDVIEVKELSECAADVEGARNNEVLSLKKFEEQTGVKLVAPQNALKVSYGAQIVGTTKMPDMASEAPLGNDREGIKILIATANDCIQDMLMRDKELLTKRHALKQQCDELDEEMQPLLDAIKAIEQKIKDKRAMIKSVDNDRQRIGLSIQDQHARILKLKKELEG